MVTKQELDQALGAWGVARETALREQEAWGTLLSNHNNLIERRLIQRPPAVINRLPLAD